MSLVRNRFHGNGLYILDEPEAALSPRRILALIFECTAKGAKEKKYYELDGFNLTREFLNCPERMLGKLFGE